MRAAHEAHVPARHLSVVVSHVLHREHDYMRVRGGGEGPRAGEIGEQWGAVKLEVGYVPAAVDARELQTCAWPDHAERLGEGRGYTVDVFEGEHD